MLPLEKLGNLIKKSITKLQEVKHVRYPPRNLEGSLKYNAGINKALIYL